MKKTFAAAALSSVLVLGLAGVAVSADAPTTTNVTSSGSSKITLDGSVRQRGTYRKSTVADNSPGSTGYDNRVQMGTAAKVSDQANAYIQLESGIGSNDLDNWGQAAVAADAGATPFNQGGAAALGTGGNKLGSLSILQAWLNYKPGPWGVKAGHMPLALGNKVFFDHTGSGDDALVFYADPTQSTHIGALTIKFDEQTAGDNSDDLDGYVALVTHKVSDALKLGANWTYLSGGAEIPTAPAAAELMRGMGMSNVGLTADGKVGAISYLADVEMQFGDFTNNGVNSQDASGWATKLGADYDLGAGKIGLVFGYGSGKNLTDADRADNGPVVIPPATPVTQANYLSVDTNNNDTQDQFINFLTDTTYDTIMVGYRVATPGQGMNSGLSNLTLIQLKGSGKTVCPLTGKDLNLMGTLSYMRTSEDVYAGTVLGGAVNYQDEVGTELDLIATWSLTAGLSYRVEAAYLWVGDAYDVKALGVSSNPDNLMFLRHGLDLKF